MEAKKYYWLKLKENFFGEKEIKKLRRMAGGDTYTIIYLKMLLLSLRTYGRIYFDGVEDSFADELALQLDEETDNVKMTIMYLRKVGLLQEMSETEAFLTQIPECVGSETSKAELMRRKRQRDGNKVTEISNNVTTALPLVTNCYPEIEKEIKKEKDTKIERDSGADAPKRKTKTDFKIPSVDEVREYCAERNNGIDPDKFHDYYTAQGWKLSNGQPMKDWKAAVRNWERRDKQNGEDSRESSFNTDEFFEAALAASKAAFAASPKMGKKEENYDR